ncbi:hypothetical protein ACU8V7_05190 [Zobellia nedashkovskayae]
MKKGTGEFKGSLTAGAYTNKPGYEDSELTADERSLNRSFDGWDGQNFQFDGNYGIAFENDGYFNASVMLAQAERTVRPSVLSLERAPLYDESYLTNNRTETNGTPIITNPELIAAQASGDAGLISSLQTVQGLMSARDIEQIDVASYSGLPAKTNMSLAFNMETPLTETSDFYAFGDIGYQYSDAYSCFYRRSAQADRVLVIIYTLTVLDLKSIMINITSPLLLELQE